DVDSTTQLELLRDALLAVCDGDWDQADRAVSRDGQLARSDAACLNLHGIICQARGEWRQARRFYSRAMRANGGYLPAEQNLRRFYELDTVGDTRLPIAVADQGTLTQIRNLPCDASA